MTQVPIDIEVWVKPGPLAPWRLCANLPNEGMARAFRAYQDPSKLYHERVRFPLGLPGLPGLAHDRGYRIGPPVAGRYA